MMFNAKSSRDYTCCDSEDDTVGPWVEVVHANRKEQYSFCHNPLHRTELNVTGVGGKVKIEDGNLGQHEIGCRLTIESDKSGPGGAGPPSHDETEESSESATAGFSSPAI